MLSLVERLNSIDLVLMISNNVALHFMPQITPNNKNKPNYFLTEDPGF